MESTLSHRIVPRRSCRLAGFLFVVLVCIALVPSLRAATWKAGSAKIAITPEKPMWMAGYSNRNRAAQTKLHDLWAKALVIEDAEGNRAVLVTLDVTGVDRRFSLRVRDDLKESYGLERRQIAINSSHTHSGPVTSDRFTYVFRLDEQQAALRLAYLDVLRKKIHTVVGQAIEKIAPCRLDWGTGFASFAINRRNNPQADVVKLRALSQLRGPVDYDVPVLSVKNEKGELVAVAFGYACHGTTLGPANYEWCGDYAGYAQQYLEKSHPSCTALYWAGCGGDQNPGPRQTVELTEKHGRELADAVETVLKGEMKRVEGSLAVTYTEVELPFETLVTKEQLQREAASANIGLARRAKFLLHELDRGIPLRPTYPYPVQTWRIGHELLLVTLGGEAVVDYALKIKQEFGEERTWVASYTNDVTGYIPSTRVLREGGYEGRTGFMIYGLPAPWGSQIEPLILYNVRRQIQSLTPTLSIARDPRKIDFEATGGALHPDRWYIGGGTNVTRLRWGARKFEGTWALSTAGDGGAPIVATNGFDATIDRPTSIAWGPRFTVNDKLPPGSKIALHVAGGSKPWNESSTSGPTGVALWDVAARDFVRGKSKEVVYVACKTNGFDFEATSISLTGLEGNDLCLAVVDRAAQSWAWTSVDNVVFTRGAVTFSDQRHHRLTILNDFDSEESLKSWKGDVASFRLGSANAEQQTILHVNQNVKGEVAGFSPRVGYLSSNAPDAGAAATGTLRSPAFTLQGDVLEFHLAGTGGKETTFELVAEDGKTLATASPESTFFAYDFWRIDRKWNGQKAHVRLVDNSNRGYVEVDAVRMLTFSIEDEPSTQPSPSTNKQASPGAPSPATQSPGSSAKQPPNRLVLPPTTVTDNTSGGKTVIQPSLVYNFQTQQLRGAIRSRLPKPGVIHCRHKPTQYEAVTQVPLHALLMPEWLLKPGNGRHGIFWRPLNAKPEVRVERGSVLFHVGAEQTKEWNMDVTFRYTPERDWIDFECKVIPHVAIKDFEFFIASYVTEDMESTWVSAATSEGEVFKKIDCRRTVPWGSVFTVARDAKAKAFLSDGRWNLSPQESGKDLWQDYYFKRPILIAMKESTGMALVTMVDPKVCSLLAGQHHEVETAHDFGLNADLRLGQPFVGRARIVIRKIGNFPDTKKQIDTMWKNFEASLKSPHKVKD